MKTEDRGLRMEDGLAKSGIGKEVKGRKTSNAQRRTPNIETGRAEMFGRLESRPNRQAGMRALHGKARHRHGKAGCVCPESSGKVPASDVGAAQDALGSSEADQMRLRFWTAAHSTDEGEGGKRDNALKPALDRVCPY